MKGEALPSRTAVMTAVARALHRDEPPPWVLDDHYADLLAGELGPQIREELVAELHPASLRNFSRWCCVRSRFPEDLVDEQRRTSALRQYVILGAGLDTFALRRPDLLQTLRVFEVDHPASQSWKQRRLVELGVDPGPNLVFAPVDFECERLDDALTAAGFDFTQAAVFAWIGVVMFLTLPAIIETLDTVARCGHGSRLVLTYNQPQTTLTGLAAETQAAVARVARAMDEPMITFFTSTEIEQLLRYRGFGQFVHVGPDEARVLYFADRPDVVLGGAQRLIVGTVRA